MFTTVGNRGTMYLGLCLRVLILSALTVPIRAAQPAPETFTLTVPDGPTSTLSGSSVSLLCQVSPLFNAEPLEVRWYHSSNSHSLALLYKDHKIQEAPVDPRYRGRVSLTGGMERGNVSLTLERVTLEDRGEYVCQVTSEQWYEKASVFLTVNVTGREPVLSVAEARGGGGQVNVTCSSEGWSPQPKLTWRNKEGTEIRNEQEVLNTSDPHGLVSVSNWLLYASSYSDWLACTVYLSEEAKREGRILPHMNTAPTAVPGVSKEAFIVTLVLLILSLVIICALCSVILCKQRGSMWSSSQKSRNRSDQAELGQRLAETEHLIEGAENTVQNPTDQRAAGNDVHLEGAENTVLTPTEQKAAGKDVNLKGAENTVQTPTEQRAAGKDVHLKGAENTVQNPTEQRAAGNDVHLEENAVLTPTEQRAAGKELNLEGAENTVQNPTEQRAAGNDVHLEENAVLTPTEQRAAGNEVNLEENTVQTPTEQRAVGKDVHLKENTVQTPTEQRAVGKDVHLKGAENTVQTPTEQRAAGEELNLKDWHQVKIFKENILLDEKTAHPAIRVNHGKQRAHYVKEKDTEKPSRTHLHVFSKESFRSGQHYWEVKVKDGTAEKLSWYVGVARENVERRPTVPLTPQNGFWILSYDKGKCFHVNTDPQPPITVAKLTIVGVFLDCDRHTLSFYHVDTESLLYTFTDVKTSNYFPLLSPGQCDKIPIKIN
ncbi:butyrophilin subfamily 3 member A1 isoform X48 [Oncorhynchus tshawytscha]|uniref:butyrophilin subfamily 3 member A1 isoform X48 n=1 Tax=Oncorhynchus tshawytscha TaxID=74940 RepID=UPI001C3DC408|nr:butyrophilin subfamily 3 member A1 isoform X48 [Oncorhynchus tshawytscha]